MLMIMRLKNILVIMFVNGIIISQQKLNIMNELGRITIERTSTGKNGTFGKLYLFGVESTQCLYTLEPPDFNNKPNISCIPIGEYVCRYDGKDLRIYDVPNRLGIKIHQGNYLKDTKGCILVGESIDSKGIWNSTLAYYTLISVVGKKFFILTIK